MDSNEEQSNWEQSTEQTLKEMQEKIEHLETLIKEQENNCFIISGISEYIAGNLDWKDKVYVLLSHANIPYYWILDMYLSNIHEPQKATIVCINSLVCNVIQIRLQKFINDSHSPVQIN